MGALPPRNPPAALLLRPGASGPHIHHQTKLSTMRKLFSMFCLLALYTFPAAAQQTFTAKVLSKESGVPLSGVTVTDGNGTSTQTNPEGIFKISLSAADTLYFSREGYANLVLSSEQLKSSTSILLTPLGTQLQEVVINNGYQPLPRERSTGAYSHLTAATLSQQVSTGILSRLESITAGLTFDRTKSQGRTGIMIRGLSTIQGPREPLIVVDNFVYSGDINNINPNEVESITVLKDAAATSVWGARAGNGVIVVSTKKGRFNKKSVVSLSSNISFTGSPNLFYLPSMRSEDLLEVEQFLFSKGFNFAETAAPDRPVFSPAYELMFRNRSGQLSTAALTAALDSLSRIDLRKQFNEHVYRSAVNTQHNISLAGGNNNTAWRFSAGLDENISDLHSRYRRINLGSNNSYKFGKQLQLNTTIAYTNSYTTAGRPGYTDLSTLRGKLPIYTALVNAQGTPVPVMNTYRQPWLDTTGAGKLLNWNYSPLSDYEHTSNKTYLQNITAGLDIQYQLLRHFTLSLKYQYENQQEQTKALYGEETYLARNLVNSFTQIDRATGTVTYGIPKGAILDDGTRSMVAHNGRAQLAYNASISNHTIAALAGWEFRDAGNSYSNYRSYGYSEATVGFSNVNYLTLYPTYATGEQNFVPSNQQFQRLSSRFISAFANAGYSYKNRYHLTASMRRDASNLFGANTNDKWNLLWSAGLGWEASKEKWFSLQWMPYLKFRTTYGKSGNVDPSISAVATISYFVVSPYTGTMSAILDKFKNPDLSWEQVATWNSGLDFKLWNGNIAGSLDVYFKKGRNLYGTTPADYTAVPATRIVKNVAAIKGSGLDAVINSININRKLQWTSELHFSTNRDEVTRYYLTNKQGAAFLNGGNNISAVEGRPVYAVYSYRWAGLDPTNGNPLGYANGTTSSNYALLTGAATTIDSLQYHGRALPAVFGSLGNTIRYKNFYFTARLTYKFGYYFRKSAIGYASLFSSLQTHSDYYSRWQKPGDENYTTVPSMTYPADTRRDNFYANTAANIIRGDHIRFQFATLGYEFTDQVYKRLPFASLNLFCNINNIGILWRANKEGIDPDYLSTVIPPARSHAVGVNIQFR
ncbi:MAG: SusC/RagA family TonB-linked outer membrane protein [Chitinophagaceae bacterium]|nr:MAG: SusC/RagA family TonB-linked outer membrane protein [Chitinophagaceae bacterium]